jgi:hypothetical protein
MTGKYAQLTVQTRDLHALDIGFENLALRSYNLKVNSICHASPLICAIADGDPTTKVK